MSRPTVEDRFLAKVHKTETCWLWIAGKSEYGYGRIAIESKPRYAHRVAYEMYVGPIPEGLVIDHMCHVTSCVNPDHLRTVTAKQNQENMGKVAAKSGIRGVVWNKSAKRWEARITHNRKRIYGGVYIDIRDAEKAAIGLRNKYFTANIEKEALT